MTLTDQPHFDESARVAPPCPHFGTCGGCQFQDIEEQAYKDFKTKTVLDLLNDNKIKPAHIHDPIFISEGVRRRVTFACARKGTGVTMGFHQRRTHDIVAIDRCLLITPALQHSFDCLKENIYPILKDNAVADISLQDIDGNIDMVITGQINRDRQESDLLKHMASIAEQCGITRIGVRKSEFDPIETMISFRAVTKDFSGLNVPIPMGAFLQPSAEGEATLIEILQRHTPPKKKMNVLDLFAGCGTFTGIFVAKGAQVTAFEIDHVAVDALQKALQASKGKSEAQQRHLFNEPVVAREMRNVDVVVLDPPRAGAKEQCQMLARSNVPHVMYISCNPQSFVRDAQTLINGGYICTDFYMVDQFKWSNHTEVVGIFTKPV